MARLKPTRADVIVGVHVAFAVEKRQQDGIDLVVATDVVDVGIEFVAELKIQSELGMNAPVILNVTGDVVVVGVGDDD